MADEILNNELLVHIDDVADYLRRSLRDLEGQPDEAITDLEAPDGRLKTVAEAREDSRRALTLIAARRAGF